MKTIKAIFVSVWDSGNTVVRTKCKYNPATKDVTDIESSDVEGLDNLDEQYVELPDGTEIRKFTIEGKNPEDEEEHLSDAEIKRLQEIIKSQKN